MKIVIPGGSGQVGTMLARAFNAAGDEVVVLSRYEQRRPWATVPWDGRTLGPWAKQIEGSDAVINLAGRSVNCRYHARNRAEILNSRVESTRVVGQAIAAASQPPSVWLQASTATIYADRYEGSHDEATGILGGHEPGVPETWRFSIAVAKAWEQALDEAVTPRTRKVALRSAITLSPDAGGIFSILLHLVRFGLGGSIGGGRQYVSWVHDEDFVRAIRWIIEHPDLSGNVNIAAPTPLPQAEFMRILRKAWGIPFGLGGTKWMMEIAAWFHRTESELILKSRRVVPGRLLASGFEFRFPRWPEAAENLCRQSRGR